MKRTSSLRRVPFPRTTPSRAGEAKARRLVYARSGDICERCGRARGAEWQHRKNRSQGGQWTADNGLHLCSPCHRYVHEHPAESAGCGWTVKRDQDPAAAAVFVRGHRWVYLTDFGTYSEYPPGGDVA